MIWFKNSSIIYNYKSSKYVYLIYIFILGYYFHLQYSDENYYLNKLSFMFILYANYFIFMVKDA
jgi:hypothetical protein